MANPASHTHQFNGDERYRKPFTSRPASHDDVKKAVETTMTEIFDLLAAENWMPHELEAAAMTLGYTEQEVMRYQGLEDNGQIDVNENYFRTALLAGVCHELLMNHCTVSNPAVLGANEKALPEWEDYYIYKAQEVFDQMHAIEKTITSGDFRKSPRWVALYAGDEGFQYYCGLLGQVQLRLGRFKLETA